MTKQEAKAILEANAVPTFPLQISQSDWRDALRMASEALEMQDSLSKFIEIFSRNYPELGKVKVTGAAFVHALKRLSIDKEEE